MADSRIDFDCADDSEPERNRIRLQAAETKKRRTRQKQLELRRELEATVTVTIVPRGSSPFSQISTHPCLVDDNTFGLEATDGVTAEAIPNHIESMAIEITDDTKRGCPKPPSESLSPFLPEDSRPRASSPQLAPNGDTNDTPGSPSESNIITHLGHLAYRQAGPASNSSRAGRSRSEPTSNVRHGKFEKLSRSSQPDSNVAKLDVGRLLRCVCCDVQWTLRKNVAHKSTHMTTCARKKGINPSTLQLLIEKELLKLRQAKTNAQKQPCSEPATAVPQTYLETVVAEAQPRKRQRRMDTIGTLQPISETRAAILHRAKALLGTRAVAPCNAPEPEQTQSFGRSKLVTGQEENFEPMLAHEESALTSRLALLRSMVESPTTHPP